MTYFDSKYETLGDADAMILLTEWKEFSSPDFEELKLKMRNPVIFDGRNQYSHLRSGGKRVLTIIQIGKKTNK